jgi:hypothetical protein
MDKIEMDPRQANGKILRQWTHRKPNPWDTGWETLYPPADQDVTNPETCQGPKCCRRLISLRVSQNSIRVQVGPSRCLLVITLARFLAGKVKQKSGTKLISASSSTGNSFGRWLTLTYQIPTANSWMLENSVWPNFSGVRGHEESIGTKVRDKVPASSTSFKMKRENENLSRVKF